jgi:hypothetical protein
LIDGGTSEVRVLSNGSRHYRLAPWPFDEPELRFEFPARHVEGKVFSTSAALNAAFAEADEKKLSVTLTQ